jgi:L-alanine-DL-glutamate epimerase-like enolase superfamily enzyme
MALHDLFARHLGIPLVSLLGRCHDVLATSITIGIKNPDETVAEAEEYLARGFRCLKVKLGHALEEDLERLRKLRDSVGPEVRIRVDVNQGYNVAEVLRLHEFLEPLGIEFVEQPLPSADLEQIRALPASLRRVLALDESLHSERDGLTLLQEPIPAAIWVIKLMKCGGITPAMALGRMAQASGRQLMWGCMDESAISIAAALHAAYACPATRFLDLDGSFDLARDPAAGGFTVKDGNLVLGDAPGLGVELQGSS